MNIIDAMTEAVKGNIVRRKEWDEGQFTNPEEPEVVQYDKVSDRMLMGHYSIVIKKLVGMKTAYFNARDAMNDDWYIWEMPE